jgi:hypothetical protein
MGDNNNSVGNPIRKIKSSLNNHQDNHSMQSLFLLASAELTTQTIIFYQ